MINETRDTKPVGPASLILAGTNFGSLIHGPQGQPSSSTTGTNSSRLLFFHLLLCTALTTCGAGLAVEFEFAPVIGANRFANPQGPVVSTGRVLIEGDWQYGGYGSLHFRFNSANHGADHGARIITYVLPAPDGAWHKINAEYDLQFVTIKRDGVVVVRDWLDQQTTEIPSRPGPAVNFNTPVRNIKVTPFDVPALLPEVRWTGLIGNSSVPQHRPSVWAAFLPANAMCAWGNYVFVASGFNKNNFELFRFHTGNPNAIDLRFGVRHNINDAPRVPIDLAIGADGLLYVKRSDGNVTMFNPTTAACFQTDEKFWLSDTATCRLIRFNTDGTPDGAVIHWTPHSYVMAIDKANPRRAFNRYVEYLDGVPVKFYGNDSDVTFGFGEGFSSVTEVNGETIATMSTQNDIWQRRQIVKLNAQGIVPTGQLVPAYSLLEGDGTFYINTRTVAGVAYTFQPLAAQDFHLTAARNGTVLWQALPTGDNTGKGTFDLRCEGGVQTAVTGCIAVVGNYVITACKMEFWKVGDYTGQGNQLFIHDKTTGQFLRQLGLPRMNRGELDNAPGAGLTDEMVTLTAHAGDAIFRRAPTPAAG